MAEQARVGIDVGGTFTDVIVVDAGAMRVRKVPSTPEAPERGVIEGLEAGTTDAGIDAGKLGSLAHGTTVATNAILEREWAETALFTTEGFRDVLEIGRQERPALYDLQASKPEPIVPRDRRVEVTERIDERGEVTTELSEESVGAALDQLPESVESVAVCLLFAFENDAHERRVGEMLEDELSVPVSLSSDVLSEIREFERTTVTVVDAAVRPVMASYLDRLTRQVAEMGIDTDLQIMGSAGGSMSASTAKRRPVRTVLSGPAAGVQGAAHVAGLAGVDDVITMDMGGTSCDVSLVEDGEPTVTTEGSVGEYPIARPMIDVHTIGAGGGSIAWVDDGGALRVGPRSAGADPGPICYGRGGEEPTVTDAQYVLGRLDPARFAADLEADESTVRAGLQDAVGDPLGRSTAEAAAGVLAVAEANMERAIRVMSVERGHDPRDQTLVAFGGAGPLHAASLAAAVDVPSVLVPPAAGALSALGLLASDVVYDYSVSRLRELQAIDPGAIETLFEEFEQEGRAQLESEGIAPADRAFQRSLDLRYAGQAYDLRIEVDGAMDAAMPTIPEQFHERHERRYGHATPGEPIELVSVRLRARGLVDPPEISAAEGAPSLAAARREHRDVWFDGETRPTPVYGRTELPIGTAFEGPAIVEGSESTVVVPPGTTGRRDDRGSVRLEVPA